MEYFGVPIIVVCLGIAFWWVITRRIDQKTILALCALGVFSGFGLTLKDRITELTFGGVGTIKAATERATIDAKTVSELRSRVENQSATVDLVAKQAISAKDASEQAEKMIKNLENSISEANSALSRIKAESDFTMIITAAQNDDRRAFDSLQKIAEDKTNEFSARAERAWQTIFGDHSKIFFSGGFKIPWNEGVDPTKFSLEDLVREYHHASSPLRPALLEYIWQRKDFREIDRRDFLINVMKNDQSIVAVEYAGRYFSEGIVKDVRPMASQYFINWWTQHRGEFLNNK